jgi:hypothetical protein
MSFLIELFAGTKMRLILDAQNLVMQVVVNNYNEDQMKSEIP